MVALPPIASPPLITPALAPVPTVTEAVTVGDGHGGDAAPVRAAEAVPPGATFDPDHPAVQTVVSAFPGAGADNAARAPRSGRAKKLIRTTKEPDLKRFYELRAAATPPV